MRITINIARPIFKELKKIQEKEGRTMGELVTGLLAEALQERYADHAVPELDWISRPMRARVDLTDKEAVCATIDNVP